MAEARQHGGVPAKLRTDASRRRAVGQPSQGSVWLPGRAYEKADGILGGAFCGTAYCELGKSPLGQQKASAIPSEHGRLLDTQQMQQFKTDEPPGCLHQWTKGLFARLSRAGEPQERVGQWGLADLGRLGRCQNAFFLHVWARRRCANYGRRCHARPGSPDVGCSWCSCLVIVAQVDPEGGITTRPEAGFAVASSN